MFGLAVLFRFPLFLFQRELKFDMGANLLTVWLERLGSFLVDWLGFCPVRLVLTYPGFVILAGISALMGLLLDLLSLVIIYALVLFVGFWVILEVQRRSF